MNCLKSEDLELNVIDDTLDSLVIKSNGLEGEGHELILKKLLNLNRKPQISLNLNLNLN